MFPHKSYLYVTQEPPLPGAGKESLDDMLLLNKRNEFLDEWGLSPTDFSKDAVNVLISQRRRNPQIFALAKTLKIPGLGNKTFKVNFEAESGIESKLKNYTISTFEDESRTNYLITLPEVQSEQKILKELKRDENGKFSAKGEDLLNKMNIAKSNLYENHYNDFDPEDIEFLQSLSALYERNFRNINTVQKYFTQLASLMLTGEFADNLGEKLVVGVKGLQGKNSLHFIHGRTLADLPKYEVHEPKLGISEDLINNLSTLLSRKIPWYKNEAFKRPLDIEKVLYNFNELGSAFRIEYEGSQPAVVTSAIATENFFSELYDALTDDNHKPLSFLEKMNYINKTLADGLLTPFIDVYTSKRTNPANRRGQLVHVGSSSIDQTEAFINSYAAHFYQDLSKTAVSIIAGTPEQYFDFDKFARNVAIIGGDKGVAYVPINTAKHHNIKSKFKLPK